MKIHHPKFNRKDPLNPILSSKAKDYEFKSISNNRKVYDFGSSNQNSSFIKSTFNNSINRISPYKQISSFSNIVTENKKTSYSNNNITGSSDNLFSCLNNKTYRAQKSVGKPRKKKVKFLNNDKLVEIILVDSHKKFHKVDDIYYNDQKDIDKIKVLKLENRNKENNVTNDIKKDLSPIKDKGEKIKDNKKEIKNNKNSMKTYDDKACKCLIF